MCFGIYCTCLRNLFRSHTNYKPKNRQDGTSEAKNASKPTVEKPHNALSPSVFPSPFHLPFLFRIPIPHSLLPSVFLPIPYSHPHSVFLPSPFLHSSSPPFCILSPSPHILFRPRSSTSPAWFPGSCPVQFSSLHHEQMM